MKLLCEQERVWNHISAEEDKEKNWVLFWVHHIVNTIRTEVTFGRFHFWFTLSELGLVLLKQTISETPRDYYNMSVLMLFFNSCCYKVSNWHHVQYFNCSSTFILQYPHLFICALQMNSSCSVVKRCPLCFKCVWSRGLCSSLGVLWVTHSINNPIRGQLPVDRPMKSRVSGSVLGRIG